MSTISRGLGWEIDYFLDKLNKRTKESHITHTSCICTGVRSLLATPSSGESPSSINPTPAGILPGRAAMLFCLQVGQCPCPHSALQEAHFGECCSLRNVGMLIIRASKDTSSNGLDSRALNEIKTWSWSPLAHSLGCKWKKRIECTHKRVYQHKTTVHSFRTWGHVKVGAVVGKCSLYRLTLHCC